MQSYIYLQVPLHLWSDYPLMTKCSCVALGPRLSGDDKPGNEAN